MRPRSRRTWMPLGRLCAFFVAVVVGGILLLHAPRLPVDPGPVGRRTDFLTRQKNRLKKRWRIFEQILRRNFGTPLPDARVDPPVAPKPPSVRACRVASGTVSHPGPAATPTVPASGARFLACLEPDPSLFDPVVVEPRDAYFDWPRSILSKEHPFFGGLRWNGGGDQPGAAHTTSDIVEVMLLPGFSPIRGLASLLPGPVSGPPVSMQTRVVRPMPNKRGGK